MSKRVSKRSTTTTNRSSRQVIDDVDRKDRSIKPTTASTKKQSVSRSSTHYYSIVPLHLIFTTYVIHFLPTIQSLKLKEPTGTIAKSRTDVLIDSLVVDPYRTLLIINSGLFLVQIWFSSSLRKLREDEINSSSDSNLVDRGGAVEDQSQKRDLLRSFSVDRVFDRSYRQNFLSSTNQNLKKSLSKFIMLVQESVTMTILGTFMIHMVMVLLGSNLIKDSLKTLLISNTVSIVCVLPTSFVIGWNRGREKQRLIRIFSSFQPRTDVENALFYPSVFSLVGCWLGAIPIPLDWDRPWQRWPITCLFGVSIGHCVGTLISIIVCSFQKNKDSCIKTSFKK